VQIERQRIVSHIQRGKAAKKTRQQKF
jgi:hypothetical protein